MVYVRDLPPRAVDEPTRSSRSDPAPEPLEALLSALGACLGVGIRANAVARGIVLSSLELEIEADIAAAPLDGTGLEPGPLGFEVVRAVVRIEADAPREALVALVSRASLWSPVANTLHNGAQLDISLAPPG
jgi:uncharacterized OsmC-like protein